MAGLPSRLLAHTIGFLTAPAPSPVLSALDQLGVKPAAVAALVGVDRQVVKAWYRGQAEIPDEQRALLLAHLSLLLLWLFGAEEQIGSQWPLWQQRTQAARRLLDLEARAVPHLARKAHALTTQMDAAMRAEALRVVALHAKRSIPARREPANGPRDT